MMKRVERSAAAKNPGRGRLQSRADEPGTDQKEISMSRRILPLLLLLCTLTSTAVPAENWPQWRGPNLDGSSAERSLPVSWSAEENIAWKTPLPDRGAATPVVWGDHIFLSVSHDPEKDDRLELWALDRRTGEVLWQRLLGKGNVLSYKQHMSTPSPVTDGEAVWVMTGTGILKAFDFAGKELWSRDLQADYGAFGLQWGYASSPLLYDGALFVQVLHGMKTDDPSYLLRIDPRTGKTVWRVERPTDAVRESPDSYATPMVFERDGKFEILITGGDVLTGHDPKTGKELWRVGDLNPQNSSTQRLVASPVVAGDHLFAFGKRGPILAFARGDGPAPKLAWSVEKGTDVPTPVTDGAHLYVIDDKGIAWCYEIGSGDLKWGPERLAVGTYSASPILADGKIYITSESGVTTVVRAAPEFEILATNEVGGYVLSSLAVARGQLFLRSDQYLYAIGVEDVPAAEASSAAKASGR